MCKLSCTVHVLPVRKMLVSGSSRTRGLVPGSGAPVLALEDDFSLIIYVFQAREKAFLAHGLHKAGGGRHLALGLSAADPWARGVKGGQGGRPRGPPLPGMCPHHLPPQPPKLQSHLMVKRSC